MCQRFYMFRVTIWSMQHLQKPAWCSLSHLSTNSAICWIIILPRILVGTKSRVVGGTVTSWLVSLTPDRAVRFQALGGNIVLCSWARHLLSQRLSPPRYINGYWQNLMLGVTLQWTSIPSRGSSNIPSCSMLQKQG